MLLEFLISEIINSELANSVGFPSNLYENIPGVHFTIILEVILQVTSIFFKLQVVLQVTCNFTHIQTYKHTI